MVNQNRAIQGVIDEYLSHRMNGDKEVPRAYERSVEILRCVVARLADPTRVEMFMYHLNKTIVLVVGGAMCMFFNRLEQVVVKVYDANDHKFMFHGGGRAHEWVNKARIVQHVLDLNVLPF